MPYSARARKDAPVAIPVTWDELADAKNAHPFLIGDSVELLDRAVGKSLRGWGFAVQALPDV